MLFWATTSFTTGPCAAAWAPAVAGPASAAAATAEAKPAAAARRSPRPGLFITSPPGCAASSRRSRRAGTQSVDVSPAIAVVPGRQPFPGPDKGSRGWGPDVLETDQRGILVPP